MSEAGIKSKGLVVAIDSDARFGVFSHAFFEEVCFALEADGFHPFEWVPDFEVSITVEAKKEPVGAEFDVIAHHGRIHADEFDGESIYHELHFDGDGAADDLDDS